MLGRFARSRSGNFAMMFALAFSALIMAVGMAIDLSNIITAKTNLRNALDSALLSASHLKEKTIDRDKMFQAFFTSNMLDHQEMINAVATLKVTETATAIKAEGTAVADVKLHFAWLFGVTHKVSVHNATYEANDALEVVMVLDNTGSMAGTKIAALRNAATALVNMFETVKSDSRPVKVSLVPFVTAVNINGEGFKDSWIDKTGVNSLNGVNFSPKTDHMTLFSRINVAWKGCVEARPTPYSVSDDEPDAWKPDTLFVPYLAPDEPGAATAANPYGNDAAKFNNSFLDETTSSSDNWNLIKHAAKYSSSTKKIISETGPLTVGPNRSCPTPVVPLTDDFAKLRTAVSKMKEWNGSGTNVSEGLSWGMRVLSPGEPYTQGKPFKTAGVTKAVLLLTDGENVVYGASGEVTKSDYGSYGFMASNRFGSTNQTTAARNVDKWVLAVCDALKKQDVQIYTVVLESDTAANRTLYSACATAPGNYYPTNSVSQLTQVFQKIGASIAQLQLTQ